VSQVPPEIIDKALKIISPLKDVQIFIAEVKKSSGTLAVRIEEEPLEGKNNYAVKILEKKEGKEILYDVLTVDIKKGKVVRRQKT
jgi:uncharacterized protein YggU (UPF0235/DUF167 family)